MSEHQNYADRLIPANIQNILDELGIPWRDKPRNGNWVNNIKIDGFADSLSINIETGAHVPWRTRKSLAYQQSSYKAQGDIVKLVRLAKGLENRTEAIKWINKIIGHPARSQMHFFSVEDARLYGIKAAVILQNIRTWLDHNLVAERNVKDGRVWTYNSRKELSNYHPYLNARQVRYQLEKLEENGLIITGKYYMKGPTDQRLWYSINEPKYTFKTNKTIRKNCQKA